MEAATQFNQPEDGEEEPEGEVVIVGVNGLTELPPPPPLQIQNSDEIWQKIPPPLMPLSNGQAENQPALPDMAL